MTDEAVSVTISSLREEVAKKINSIRDTIKTFCENLEKDPWGYSGSSLDGMQESAARLAAWQNFDLFLEGQSKQGIIVFTDTECAAIVEKMMHRSIDSVSQSTSPCRNSLDLAYMRAVKNFADNYFDSPASLMFRIKCREDQEKQRELDSKCYWSIKIGAEHWMTKDRRKTSLKSKAGIWSYDDRPALTQRYGRNAQEYVRMEV